jgi:hypothetical protein
VDDRVVGVEQHPIAMGQAFDTRRGEAVRFESLDQTIRYRPDMDVGASRGDKHQISESGFAAQIDRNDVFSFGVFEAGRDRLGEEASVGFNGTGNRRGRREGRFTIRRESQCLGPPSGRRRMTA